MSTSADYFPTAVSGKEVEVMVDRKTVTRQTFRVHMERQAFVTSPTSSVVAAPATAAIAIPRRSLSQGTSSRGRVRFRSGVTAETPRAAN
ncbi:hypothetical protein ADK86_05410 [Streptomyces sp. NRRL F-5755]|uniref:hypothetical protein n=1 Tax=Streptomyces sp. NRRL F-5755 TaxID=1519475 RepID=UPI0006C2ABBE|nr:hypothetical protein [Streptomyces sp. NRRL F-5755]KOU07158.1 hypothetical protein ADK86_05410 [Streptomyces sp. NRRL F-5755]